MNRFLLKTCAENYSNEEKEKLEKFGFKFYPYKGDLPKRLGLLWTIDDDYYPEMEIYSMDELLDFMSEIGYPIIVHGHTLEIYDDYKE